MGFITKQWVNKGLRSRRHDPLSVSIVCNEPGDAWALKNEVKVEFTARKPNREFQTLCLTQAEADGVGEAVVRAMSGVGRERLLTKLRLSQAEADGVGEAVVSAMSGVGRERLLVRFLRALTHAKLLKVLALDLSERVRLPKRRQR